MFFRLVRTDLKRISTYGRYLAAAAFMLIFIFLGLATRADDLIYSKDDSQPMNIGIVMSADSQFARIAYESISSMDSFNDSCSFTEIYSKDNALDMLESGSLFAVIYVPDNIISDIMDGTNTPVEVYYSDNRSLNTFVLNDLFRSTSSMLGISQAAIYSVQAIGRNLELPTSVQNSLSDEVNTLFLQNVLNRSAAFAINEINATRAQSTTDFYVCAAIILIIMLCGIILISFKLNVPRTYTTKLCAHNVGHILQAISSYISFFVWNYIIYVTVYAALVIVSVFNGQINVHLSIRALLFGFTISGLISLIVLIVSLIPAGLHGCTLLLVTVTVITAYLSGFFIPEAMLPNFAKAICHSSIFNQMAQHLCRLICL